MFHLERHSILHSVLNIILFLCGSKFQIGLLSETFAHKYTGRGKKDREKREREKEREGRFELILLSKNHHYFAYFLH